MQFAGGIRLSEGLDALKIYMRRYINSLVPGYINILDNYSYKKYGFSAIDLFFIDPIKLYDVLMDYYRDSFTADFALQKLFLRPLAIKSNNTLIEEKLLQLIKQGKTNEVKEILAKIISTL